eukprot:scaffold10158_cov187-Skeletonema_marinoi.AAC.1
MTPITDSLDCVAIDPLVVLPGERWISLHLNWAGALAEAVIEFPSRMEQLNRELVKVKQVEAQSVGSKDVEGEVAAVDHCAAAAAVLDSAVDESVLQCTEGEAAVVVAAASPEPAAVPIHVDLRYYRWN